MNSGSLTTQGFTFYNYVPEIYTKPVRSEISMNGNI